MKENSEPPRRALVATSALAAVIASPAATIVWHAASDAPAPVWLGWAQAGALLVLFIIAIARAELRPIRGAIAALLAFVVGWKLVDDAVVPSATWRAWVDPQPFLVRLFASRAALALPTALMLLTLVGSGISRRELFLAIGDPRAPARPSRLLSFKEPIPWTRLAAAFLAIFGVVLPAFLFITIRPDVARFSRVIAGAPLILAAAAVNAASEEILFRSVLLARLGPAIGARSALWLTAVFFGSCHWYGQPSGPIGVALAAFAGWLWGKSMLETRGFVWAFVIHAVQDVVIFAFLAMALVA